MSNREALQDELQKLKPSGSFPYRFFKRTFDIFASVILMIPVWIVIAISAVFIKTEDHGSVFYKAPRIGKFGKTYKMYKLRSMKENAPDIRLADGSTYNGEDDFRVTKFGKFARKMSIDELPQIINVIKGDMTFIGPRPDTPIDIDDYSKEELIILTVRPGITGYNQVINRNSVFTKEKLKNDVYYVKNLSIWLDLKIAFLTIIAVFRHKNINRSNITINDAYILANDSNKTDKLQ